MICLAVSFSEPLRAPPASAASSDETTYFPSTPKSPPQQADSTPISCHMSPTPSLEAFMSDILTGGHTRRGDCKYSLKIFFTCHVYISNLWKVVCYSSSMSCGCPTLVMNILATMISEQRKLSGVGWGRAIVAAHELLPSISLPSS